MDFNCIILYLMLVNSHTDKKLGNIQYCAKVLSHLFILLPQNDMFLKGSKGFILKLFFIL